MGRFTGKRILITGGTRGIGLAGALRIVEEGGTVAVTATINELFPSSNPQPDNPP
ncbi:MULTISPECIES: hypothetical protein [unclassified Pseudomonas]|uniref:hypothetical protein n=1 Tax=unclassified Pseudomonas TaxID=196821 RepID=UPI0019125B55|nr:MULTISPECIES: hypothetical protein [unclassified Pseudomonas]MBK5550302.1 hypothetical protein [Pseudomonas sp. TH03]MEB0226426.1 hypothetical protein [Pseudomonas sp. 5S1]MEB0295518.1 hypothetical protein [Pseudomonas sp. 10S4]WPX21355.1 hypothetical protein RHM58_16790 [Pseudomonas sp. 10S4]